MKNAHGRGIKALPQTAPEAFEPSLLHVGSSLQNSGKSLPSPVEQARDNGHSGTF